MQKTWNKFTSLVIACVMMIACLFGAIATLVMPQTTAVAAETATPTYKKVTEAPTDWSGDYLIVYEAGNVAFNGGLETLDAVSNTIGVTIADGVIEANDTTNAAKFTIAKVDGGYSIKSASGKYIGRNTDANELDESTSTQYTNTITMDADGTINIKGNGGAYLRFNAASNQNRFRYYKSSSYSSQKAICLYKYEESSTVVVPDKLTNALNDANAYMSLSYSFETKEEAIKGVTDTLNRESTGVTSGSSTYTDWTYTATSGVIYVGQSAGGNNAIQIRSKNSNSGIVTTTSIGTATKISVKFASATTRNLLVYGSNTAYTAPSDLFDTTKQGTEIGSLTGTSDELTINSGYKYIGLRSEDGAIYVSSIEIAWDNGSSSTTTETVFQEGSEFKIRFGVEADWNTIKAVDGVSEYGIRVSTSAKPVPYKITEDMKMENGIFYVVISLGDCIANPERLTTVFTVQAYVVYNGETVLPTKTTNDETSAPIKKHSIQTLVEEYCARGIATEGNGLEKLDSYIKELN